MLKALWDWLRNPPERRWNMGEMQERVLALEMEWSDVLDKIMAREDRERKRRMKALRDMQEAEAPVVEGVTAPTVKDGLRARLRAARGIR